MGLALALIFGLSPLSVCGFLSICSFLPVKGNCLFYNLTDARPPRQAGGRSVYGTYYTYSTYQVFLRLWVIIKKARIIKGFRRFRACFFVVFWYTIIARSVHNYRTSGIQLLHVRYTKIARPPLWLYVYAYNAFTVFGYCVAFYKSFGFPIIKYGRRIFPYASFFGFGGV